jgi:hypothetical protein
MDVQVRKIVKGWSGDVNVEVFICEISHRGQINSRCLLGNSPGEPLREERYQAENNDTEVGGKGFSL